MCEAHGLGCSVFARRYLRNPTLLATARRLITIPIYEFIQMLRITIWGIRISFVDLDFGQLRTKVRSAMRFLFLRLLRCFTSPSMPRALRGNSKHQAPNYKQAPITKIQNVLKIGIWNLFGIWNLWFRISVQSTVAVVCTAGFPHSVISGSKPARRLPEAYRSHATTFIAS